MTQNNFPIMQKEIIDAIESSLRILTPLQSNVLPTQRELKDAIDTIRMARSIITVRGGDNVQS